MSAVVAVDYRVVLAAADEATGADESERRRTLARLRREPHRIGQRDHIPPPERDAAWRAVGLLGAAAEAAS